MNIAEKLGIQASPETTNNRISKIGRDRFSKRALLLTCEQLQESLNYHQSLCDLSTKTATLGTSIALAATTLSPTPLNFDNPSDIILNLTILIGGLMGAVSTYYASAANEGIKITISVLKKNGKQPEN